MDTSRRWWIPVVMGLVAALIVLGFARVVADDAPSLRSAAAPSRPSPRPTVMEPAQIERTSDAGPRFPDPSPIPTPANVPSPVTPTVIVRPRIVIERPGMTNAPHPTRKRPVSPRPTAKPMPKPTRLLTPRPTSNPSGRPAPKPTPRPSGRPASEPTIKPVPTPKPTIRSTPRRPLRVDKLMIVIFENHGYWAVRRNMPFTWALAQRYAHAKNFYAVRIGTSLPNYIALVGGGVWLNHNTPDADRTPIRTKPTIFGQAIRAGRTAKTYAESMRGTCDRVAHGFYKVHHNPWTFFTAERRLCERFNVPYEGSFAKDVARGTLPNLSLVVPHNCDNAHEPCSIAAADRWFRAHMVRVMRGRDWRSGRLLVVQTWDEDNRGDERNRILTAFIHPSLRHRVISKRLTLFSLSRLASQITGTAPLYRARSAPSIVGTGGLRFTAPIGPGPAARAPSRRGPR